MFKTAIIGAGNISYSHAKALKDLGIGIAGVLDYNPERAKELAVMYQTKVIMSLNEVFPEIDMVHILTPPAVRVEYVRQAAAAGKHIFIEKPIAMSISDAKEIITLAAAGNVKLMTGYNHRFRKGFRILQEAVEDGRLGEIIGVYSQRLGKGGGFGSQAVLNGWRTDPKMACGMCVESISHDIDMLLHLVDGVESISANTYSTMPEIPNYENNACVTFRLKNGGTGVIHASWTSYIGYSARGVIGTKGTAMITGNGMFNFNDFILKTNDMPYETVTKVNDRFEEVDDRFDFPSVFRTINNIFVECIEKDQLPPSTGEDGLKALIFSQAIIESNKTGQPIKVDL